MSISSINPWTIITVQLPIAALSIFSVHNIVHANNSLPQPTPPKSGSCVSSNVFDIKQKDPLNPIGNGIKKPATCSPPPKVIPSILEEHTGKGVDGKIRVQPNNSMENVRKRFHRMKRPFPKNQRPLNFSQ